MFNNKTFQLFHFSLSKVDIDAPVDKNLGKLETCEKLYPFQSFLSGNIDSTKFFFERSFQFFFILAYTKMYESAICHLAKTLQFFLFLKTDQFLHPSQLSLKSLQDEVHTHLFGLPYGLSPKTHDKFPQKILPGFLHGCFFANLDFLMGFVREPIFQRLNVADRCTVIQRITLSTFFWKSLCFSLSIFSDTYCWRKGLKTNNWNKLKLRIPIFSTFSMSSNFVPLVRSKPIFEIFITF